MVKSCQIYSKHKSPESLSKRASWSDFTYGISLIFVCVEVLRPSQPNGVKSSVVSLSNHRFTGQAWSSKGLTSIVHNLLPETDNCPS